MLYKGGKHQRDNNKPQRTRMVKDGEDWHGLQTTKLENVG